MKVLVFGPSGSGKTYVAQALKKKGIAAYEDEDIKGLSAWYDKDGNKVAAPDTAHEALSNHYSFLWSRKVLKKFLDQFSEVYVFGGSGNLFNLIELFDKAFFLKVEPHIQAERIRNGSRQTPLMDFDGNDLVIWGDWLELEAKKRNITCIDATLSSDQIFELIRSKKVG